MQKIDIDYSLKNIPLQTKKSYQMDLVKNLQKLCWRIRWKALKGWGCFDKPDGSRPTKKETFGFKSAKTPKLPTTDAEYPHIDWGKVKPEVEMLKEFEEELFKVPTKVKFRYFDNPLQRAMREDLKKVKNSGRVVVKADKTRNFYGVLPKFYNDVMASNIHGGGDYVEVDPVELDEVNQEAAELAAELGIDERVEVFQKKPAFINFKDTKSDFSTAAAAEEVPVRLITPSKSQMGKVSKVKLQRLNAQVRRVTNYNQWRQTRDATRWLEGLPQPGRGKLYYFFQFDFKSF